VRAVQSRCRILNAELAPSGISVSGAEYELRQVPDPMVQDFRGGVEGIGVVGHDGVGNRDQCSPRRAPERDS